MLRPDALPALTLLGLTLCPVGDDGARVIAGWPGFARLTTLDLGSTGLTAAGVRALADSLFAPATLERLDMTGNMPDADLAPLVERYGAAVQLTDDIPF